MFQVSEGFKSAIRQNTREYEWSGTITTKGGKEYAFTSKDIVKGSGYIKWQCCSDSEIELGTVYSSEMGISLFSEIDRYSLFDAQVRLYYTLTLSGGKKETIPMGIFEVTEANRKIKTLELKGYDYMLRFDKTLKLESSSGTPYQFLKAACDACKVTLAQTNNEISDMPNGKTTLGIYADNDIETFRDLIFYVAQLLGGFCQIDRYGRLVIKHYGNAAIWTVPQTSRFDSSYSDFITRYTAVSSTNLPAKASEYIAVEPDDGLTMNLGTNPLMQFGVKSVREKMLRAILTELQNISYLPFDSSTIGNPALEPGDIIKCTGGHADDNKLSCITAIEFKINGKTSIKCVGKNPKLAEAKSKNEKNITGLINSVENGKTIIYNFVNVSPFRIGQSLTNVMDIDFTATEDTTAAFHCEMLLEVERTDEKDEDYPELTIVYKMNGDTIDTFMPTKTCLYGKHIVTLFLPISKVIENSANTFSMYLKMSSGQINIGEAQIRATISGQGLAAGLGDWNGRININQNIPRIGVGNGPFMVDVFEDDMKLVLPQMKRPGFTQTIGDIVITRTQFTIDSFTDRTWIAEILRTFVLTSVRGKPKYNDYITINSNEAFLLRKRYLIDSEPVSADLGFVEEVTVNLNFLEETEEVEINGVTPKYRPQLVVNTASTFVIIPDEIDISNQRFELIASKIVEQHGEDVEFDDGYLTEITVDLSEFEGVKGVEFII